MSNSPIPQNLAKLILARGLTLVTAESCTGGLIAHMLTNIPGSSSFFLGGVVSYSNELKMSLLGVPQPVLEAHGAVSEATALAMAQGARARLGGDIGVSVTGIAGPGGGTADKPVGLTFIGVSAPWGDTVQRYTWEGDRWENKRRSAEAALQLVEEGLPSG